MTVAPDTVVSFEIAPGTLTQFLQSRPEGGPRLKCLEGSVTLVSPGQPHETAGARLDLLILAVCTELRIKRMALESTTWTLPAGAGDTAYEADKAYLIQNHGTTNSRQPPDLVIEIVVSHPAHKALRAGELLRIPEMWVMDVPQHRLTFHLLALRGKYKGRYRPSIKSRAFPFLTSAEVLERLDDPADDDVDFFRNCQEWARQVLAPRRGA